MKTPHDSLSEELLARYFEQTATEAEIDQIDRWADLSPENSRGLEGFRVIWEAGRRAGKKKAFNTDAAWKNVAKKIEQPNETLSDDKLPDRQSRKKVKRTLWPITLAAAASVALLALTFGWLRFRDQDITAEQVLTSSSTRESTKEVVLSDGTKVFLNFNSKLIYPEHFTGDIRNVTLIGEAFFEVQRDTLHPFIIKANDSEIKVLGTSFNVRAYDKAPVRVDVATGKVLMRNAKSEMYLTRNQSAEELSDTVRMVMPYANLTSYRTGIFEFSATDLKDVVSSIRNGYHADVRLASDRLSQCRLTIRFEKEPLEETLSVIAESLSLKLRKEGKTYWLEGEGCQ